MRRFFVLIFLFLFNLPLCSRAAEVQTEKINLTKAIDIAIENNVNIQSSRLNVDIQKNNINIANRLQNPAVMTFYNFGRAGQGNPEQIGLAQTLELGKRYVRKKLAKSTFELTKETYDLAKFSLKMDVRKAYINLVTAKSIYNVLYSQQKLLEELLTIAKKRFEVGVSPEIDVLQAEIALNQVITQVNTARTNVQSAKFEFNKTLNLKDSFIVYETADDLMRQDPNFIDLLTPRAKAKLPDFKDISEMAANKRFDLKIAKQNIKVAQDNLVLVGRQRIPDLQLAGGYEFQPAANTNGDGYLRGGFVGVNLVNIPLFYNYSPEIKNAKLMLEQAKLNYESTHTAAINNLNSTYAKFITSQTNLNYYTDNMLTKSEELIKASKKSYEIGKSNLTSLIVMEQSYQSIRTGYILAISDYYNSWIDFLSQVNDEEFGAHAESL